MPPHMCRSEAYTSRRHPHGLADSHHVCTSVLTAGAAEPGRTSAVHIHDAASRVLSGRGDGVAAGVDPHHHVVAGGRWTQVNAFFYQVNTLTWSKSQFLVPDQLAELVHARPTDEPLAGTVDGCPDTSRFALPGKTRSSANRRRLSDVASAKREVELERRQTMPD